MPISANVERIIHEVNALSDVERDEFKSALDKADEVDLTAKWKDEIHRRAKEVQEGKVQLITEEDFLSKLRTV